jgi:hypothetical protein
MRVEQQKIAKYNIKKLQDFWRKIQVRDTPGWEAGKAFEYLVLRAFELEGAEVRWPYSVRIDGNILEQIDGVIYTDGLACLIECKDQNIKTNIEPIAKLRNQLLRRPGSAIGVVFSSKGFTEPAVTLARFSSPQTILLWESEEIGFALKNSHMRKGLIIKYRACIEHGFPNYNIQIAESL